MQANLQINGEKRTVEVDPGMPLLWVLRDRIKLTGTKFGCGVAFCGACTVLIDGKPTRSCVTPVESLNGKSVETIEGLDSKVADAVQQAWIELNVVQCGYCQSGQIVSAVGLLTENPSPSVKDIEKHMWGNACRCATYQRIRAAVQRAAEILEG